MSFFSFFKKQNKLFVHTPALSFQRSYYFFYDDKVFWGKSMQRIDSLCVRVQLRYQPKVKSLIRIRHKFKYTISEAQFTAWEAYLIWKTSNFLISAWFARKQGILLWTYHRENMPNMAYVRMQFSWRTAHGACNRELHAKK